MTKERKTKRLRYRGEGFWELGEQLLARPQCFRRGEAAAQGQQGAQPTGDRKTSDPGPTNQPLDAQNPDSDLPPSTDAGGVQTFKYPFSLAHKRLRSGGWSREVTVRELAVSTSIAGVDMRLTAGGVRELHWHAAGEWAIMLYGNARITAIDSDGKSFVADVKEGDLWYFPTGIPHSIQGLNPDGAEFLLVFDDGNFSEYATVLLSDWMAHTPRDVLAKNFGVSEQALEKMPKEELFIFQAAVPGPLADDQRVAGGALGASPHDFAYRTMDQPVTKRTKGGEVRIVDSSKFKVSTTMAAAIVTVHPGGIRELHWHPNADEWQYFISGKGRMTVFATGRARSHDGFSGGRRRLHSKNAAALRGEHRRHRSEISRDVQEQLLSGPFAFGMAHAYAAGAGRGTPQY